MRGSGWLVLALLPSALLMAEGQAGAQEVVITDQEHLASDRPEAWAMHYVGAATLMTAGGATPAWAPGDWDLALDLGHIPRLDAAQQTVGFRGTKREDLNKSPVFARLRWRVGLPAGFVAELGYTPPLEVDGTRTRDLFAAAVGRRLAGSKDWSLSARAFGQHGWAQGDITCPEEVVGSADPEVNPAGCIGRSRDRIALRHYGVDLTAARDAGAWQGHATLGVARMEPVVQVDAPIAGLRDRSRLVARGVLPFVAIGVRRALAPRWSIGAELLHVPLDVRREDDGPVRDDAFTSLRLQLRHTPH
jgi:hypothetical protein